MTKRCKGCTVGMFGACSLDYCYGERQGLIEEAQRFAQERGHVLSEFVKVKGYPVWQAQCARCGASAAIRLDPEPNEPEVYGHALSADCPSSESG